ncbi:hypothetical protein P9112_012856 [Eukaryota sp. TZLM1-RC]
MVLLITIFLAVNSLKKDQLSTLLFVIALYYDLSKCAHHPGRFEPPFDEFSIILSQKRGDVQCVWYDGTELFINYSTESPWKRSSKSDIQHLLKAAELFLKSKYEALLQRLIGARGRNIKFIAIAISFFATIGTEGLNF